MLGIGNLRYMWNPDKGLVGCARHRTSNRKTDRNALLPLRFAIVERCKVVGLGVGRCDSECFYVQRMVEEVRLRSSATVAPQNWPHVHRATFHAANERCNRVTNIRRRS